MALSAAALSLCAPVAYSADKPALASVDELPIDRFDEYQAGTLPLYPWTVTGTTAPGVQMALLAEGESAFPANLVAGKGLVMKVENAGSGAGYGLQRAFTPPPPGPLYLGFDFKFPALQEGTGDGVDLLCELTGPSGGGLSLTLGPSSGISVVSADKKAVHLADLQRDWWYHIGVTISEKNEVSIALFQEEKQNLGLKIARGQLPKKVLQSVTIKAPRQYTTLRFVNQVKKESKGSWMLDNIAMGGKVDADRSAWLPFKQMPADQLRAQKPKVYCYYYPIYPSGYSSDDPGLSWYNLTTINASVKIAPDRANAGTKLFYHPLVRPPLKDGMAKGEQLVTAMEEEVRLGIQNGFDGFIVDFFAYPSHEGERYNDNAFALIEAAHRVDPGFKVIPAIYDESKVSTSGTGGTSGENDPLVYAQSPVFQKLATMPGVLRLDDGRMVLSMWMTERRSVDWWKAAMAELSRINIPVALLTQFNTKDKLDIFAPIVYGMGSWGQRSPVDEGWIGIARKHTNLVMAPIASHDFRTRGSIFWESKNFDTVRKMWQLAIDGKADWVCLNTWSDYSEQAMAPSTDIGFSIYDLNTYYGQWFKTGKAPEITRDVLYYSYRLHHSELQPMKNQKWTLVRNGGMKAVSDDIELLGFLKEPGELQIKIAGKTYTQNAPAGITSFKVPLPQGEAFVPEFCLVRHGKTLITHKGQFPVMDVVEYANMLYHSGVLTSASK